MYSSIASIMLSLFVFFIFCLLFKSDCMLQNKKSSKDSATARFYSHVVVSLLLCLMLLTIEPDFKVCVAHPINQGD